jgi:alkylhydroperoxidase family enzyme
MTCFALVPVGSVRLPVGVAGIGQAVRITEDVESGDEAVPDEVWQDRGHFNEEQLSAITLMISLTNFFDRVTSIIE